MLISPYQQISNQPISVYGQSFGMPEFDGEEYDKKQKRSSGLDLPTTYPPSKYYAPETGIFLRHSRPTDSSSLSRGMHPFPRL